MESLGPLVPTRGTVLRRWIGRAVLAVAGWRVVGALPNVPRMVIIVAPHTTNWDFLIAVFARMALGLDARFLGKTSLFESPIGWWFRWMGGIPVDRSQPHGIVGQMVEAFETSERLVLALAPEGTRTASPRWRTGFYYIALHARVPIVMVSLDYTDRVLAIGPDLLPSGDLRADFATITARFEPVRGKYPKALPPLPTEDEAAGRAKQTA